MPPLLALLLLAPPEALEAYEHAIRFIAENRAAQAIPLLERAARLDPANAQFWKALGVANAMIEDYRGAIGPFRRACSLNPRLPDACYYLGRAYYASDQYEKAIEPLRTALSADPVKARAETALAQCFEALIRPADAERLFRSAIARKDSALQPARLAYARFLTRQGRPAEAAAVAAAAQQPESPEALFELAFALSQCGRLADALRAAERALKLKPDYEEAFVLRSKIRARLTPPSPQ